MQLTNCDSIFFNAECLKKNLLLITLRKSLDWMRKSENMESILTKSSNVAVDVDEPPMKLYRSE